MVEETKFELATLEDVETAIEDLHSDIESNMDVESAKERFEAMASLLEEKREKVKSTVIALEKTKETLREEMHNRNEEEIHLSNDLEELNSKKAEIETGIQLNQKRTENIIAEKKRLEQLTHNLKIVLDEMKEKLAE